MMLLVIVTTVLFVSAAATFFESQWTSPDEHYEIVKFCKSKGERVAKIEDNYELLRRNLFIGEIDAAIPPQIKIFNVTVKTCQSTESDPLKVDFQVLGETLLPGYAKLAFDITSEIDVFGDLVMEVEATKFILAEQVRLPCINNIGSCLYTGPCHTTPEVLPCPSEFSRQNIPCKCPAQKGRYKSDDFKLYLGITEIGDIPGWLTDGRYAAEINIRTGTRRMACLNAEMDIVNLTKN